MWHLHTRNPICPRMLTNSFCTKSDSTDWRDEEYFRSSRNLPTRVLRAGARPAIVGDELGHVGYRRDPECLRQSWWKATLVERHSRFTAPVEVRSKTQSRF